MIKKYCILPPLSPKQLIIIREYKRDFIEYIKEQVVLQDWHKVDNKFNHLYMDGYFFMPHTHIDAANCDKILSDAITESGVVWEDDSGIMFRPQRIYYDKDNPRIELQIYESDYVGVFDDHTSLELFETICKTCSRYKRNCSILKKAKEGRIQDELGLDLICRKYKEKK